MQLELVLSNERRALPSVRAFAHEALTQLPLDPSEGGQLAQLVVAAVEDAVAHAYRDGEEGSIKLAICEKNGQLEIRVRDFGMPLDVESMERQLHASGDVAATLFGCHTAGLVDEMHWLAFGPDGKALELRKWLPDTSVAERVDPSSIEPFRDDSPPAPPQDYTVRRMVPADAVGIAQLMYRAYGGSYFNRDVYYPQRIIAHNANESIISFVVEATDGYIAGHEALELNQPGPVAETGQAVVDPAHRGRGLLSRLRGAALEVARQRDLAGWYGDAVAVHTLTQKSNRDHGGQPTCVDLAISPKSEMFHGIATGQPQRVTCLMYFHWLKPATARTLYVPARHQQLIEDIYDNLRAQAQFGKALAPTGHGTLAVRADSGAATGYMRANQLGADTLHRMRHAKRELVERSAIEAVYAELPLADPGTPVIAEQLEQEGFGLAGICPHFSARGDVLRMVYLVEPLKHGPIKTLDGFESRLVDYTLAEQARVQTDL